jgi:hypothetical protein
MESKPIVLKTFENKIQPFKHIRIGDPLYFDRLETGVAPELYKDLVCNIKTNCCKVGQQKLKNP